MKVPEVRDSRKGHRSRRYKFDPGFSARRRRAPGLLFGSRTQHLQHQRALDQLDTEPDAVVEAV
jgi:hypothetical protein